MRGAVSCLLLSIAVLGTSLAAQSPPATSPDRPSGSSAPAAIDGKWTMTVEVESPDRVSTLELKLDGSKISGAILTPSGGEYPLTGEVADGKLRFTAPYRDLTLKFDGGLKEDGTLAGTLDYGETPVSWKAERIKDR